MALGDIVQVGTRIGSGSASSYAPTLGVTATSGNLLVAYGTVTTAGRTATTPTGWTVGPTTSGGTAFSSHVFWKQSDGTETGVTINLSGVGGGYYNIIEIDGTGATLSATDANAEDVTNISTAVSSQSTGTANGAASSGIAVAFFGADIGGNIDGGHAYTNSFTERDTSDLANTSRGGYFLASKTITGTSNECTFSNTEGSEELYGAILVWSGSASFAIDTPPGSITAGTQASVVVSNPAVTPTTGNTEIKWVDDTGPAATVDSVTGSGPYTINFTFSTSTAKQFDATGYPLYVEVAAENATTSNIPYNEPAGWDFTDLASPVTTSGSILEGYSGDTPVTGDQVVYTTPTSPGSIGFTVGADGEWTLNTTPSQDQTVSRYVIQADGTVGTTDVATFSIGSPPASPSSDKIVRNVVKTPTASITLSVTR